MKPCRLLGITVSTLYILLLSGCTSDSPVTPDPNSGTITTGTRTPAESFSATASGGTFSVSDQIANGMTITIPASAFSAPTTFTISSAPVTNHTYGPVFTPISDLIRIDNGGGYASQPFRITIPITLPTNHFAMGFFYDEETGELEGIPATLLSDTAITLLTAHVHGKRLSDGTKGGILGSKSYVDLIIASINKNELESVQNSGFMPGVDDWEFVNNGSYITPNGHCAGQAVTAMWYYSMKKLRENQPSLYGRYDLAPKPFWQDNPRGYRFASVVQKKINWDSREAWLEQFENTGTKTFSHDVLHYLSFCYAIKVTGKPQYVSIRSATGGHALIVYKAGTGKLWVADPNYPGNTSREIVIGLTGTFEPYMSGANANSLGTPYPHINYIAKSSFIDHAGIDAEWKKVENGTIGNDVFPAWTLMVKPDGEPDFIPATSDTLYADASGKIVMEARCVSCQYGYPTTRAQDAMLITPNYALAAGAVNGTITLSLAKGQQRFLGLYVMSQVGTNPDNDSSYLDFRWLTCIRRGLTITPSDTLVDVGVTVKFVARSGGTAPANARYEWYFTDLDDPVSVNNDSTFEKSFPVAGRYNVGVIVYDRATGKGVDTAQTTISVGKEWNKIYIQIADYSVPVGSTGGPIVMSDGSRSNYLTYMNSMSGLSEPCYPLSWSGDSFSATIDCSDENSVYTTRIEGSVSGTMSKDRKTLQNVTVTTSTYIVFKDDGSTQPVSSQSISLNNVPIEYVYGALSGPGAVLHGTKAVPYVAGISFTLPKGGGAEERTLQRVDWSSGETKLTVLFP